MFKWFAPLLLFLGKPDIVVRIATAAVAGAVLFVGVYLLSNIALTFDALKNPYIIAAYGSVLFCFFLGVGVITWLRLRRVASSPRAEPARLTAEPPPLSSDIVGRRAEQIIGQWERGGRHAATPGKAARLIAPEAPPGVTAPNLTRPDVATSARPTRDVRAAPASLLLTGPAYAGKTSLANVLAAATAANASENADVVRIVDGGAIEGDDTHLAALTARAAKADGILFVVDQDLRAPEVAAIKRFIAAGKPLYVVLNKADQFTAADRDAILVSIRAKLPEGFAAGRVVSVAAAPSAVEREIEDARGAVRLELRQPSGDIRALLNLLKRIFPVAQGRTLRFEAG